MELNPIIRRKQGSSGGGGIGGIIGTIVGGAGGLIAGGGSPMAALQGAQAGNMVGGVVGGAADPAEAPINSNHGGPSALDKISSLAGSGMNVASLANTMGPKPPSYGQGAGGYSGANLGVDSALTRRRGPWL